VPAEQAYNRLIFASLLRASMIESLLPESRKSRRTTIKQEGSQALSMIGLVIIASSLNLFIFSILPLQVLRADWQLRAASALLSISVNLLIGALLIFLATLISSESVAVKRNMAMLRLIARWLPILLLIMIPFTFYAGMTTINAQVRQSRVELSSWNDQLINVKGLRSEADLRRWAASMPNPPQIPQPLTMSFASMKQRLVDGLAGKVNSITNQIDKNTKEAWSRFLVEFFRNSIQALVIAFGFRVLKVSDDEIRRV
jgi:hypothetical protein